MNKEYIGGFIPNKVKTKFNIIKIDNLISSESEKILKDNEIIFKDSLFLKDIIPKNDVQLTILDKINQELTNMKSDLECEKTELISLRKPTKPLLSQLDKLNKLINNITDLIENHYCKENIQSQILNKQTEIDIENSKILSDDEYKELNRLYLILEPLGKDSRLTLEQSTNALYSDKGPGWFKSQMKKKEKNLDKLITEKNKLDERYEQIDNKKPSKNL